MFKFKVVELTFKCLVFTSLACVVLLRENALTTGNAWREVAATLSAVYVTNRLLLWKFPYNSVIRALQSFLGQLNSFFGLSTGGWREKRLIASIS